MFPSNLRDILSFFLSYRKKKKNKRKEKNCISNQLEAQSLLFNPLDFVMIFGISITNSACLVFSISSSSRKFTRIRFFAFGQSKFPNACKAAIELSKLLYFLNILKSKFLLKKSHFSYRTYCVWFFVIYPEKINGSMGSQHRLKLW